MSTEQTISKDLALRAIGTIASLAAKRKGKMLSDALTPSQMQTFRDLSRIAIGGELDASEMEELAESVRYLHKFPPCRSAEFRQIDLEFIARVESNHFRTDEDTGANECALMIWNMVREHAGLQRLSKSDLPAHCKTHGRYHVIRRDYGCERSKP